MRILKLLFLVLFCACKNPEECFESTGEIIEREVELEKFDKIFLKKGIEVVINQSDKQKVIIQSGKNLINNIDYYVENNTLFLEDKTSCNFTRNYKNCKVFISIPDLKEIDSKTEYNISSTEFLNFKELYVKSTKEKGDDYGGVGDVNLKLNVEKISIVTNGTSNFKFEGTTNHFHCFFAAGTGRCDAENLKSKSIYVFHRSHNDIVVHPIDWINGDLFSNGNLYLKNIPTENLVNVHYTGKIYY
jgi:hypothetical protein